MRRALEILGYRVTGPNGVHDRNIKQNLDRMTTRLSKKYDSFQDNPWPIVYKKMDALYPKSKFILTGRDPDIWIESQVRHFGKACTPMRELIYGVGCPEGNEQRYIDTLVYHNHCVFEYFNDREEDFLAMDITRGDGWQKLCAFLGKPTPSVPFPHANKAQDRRTNVHKFPILLRARSRLRRFIDEKTPF